MGMDEGIIRISITPKLSIKGCHNIYLFVLTLLICISCFNLVYHVFGIGIGRFSVDLMIECVVWWILRVISARWLAWYRLSPPVVVDVITDLFCLCSYSVPLGYLFMGQLFYIFFFCGDFSYM